MTEAGCLCRLSRHPLRLMFSKRGSFQKPGNPQLFTPGNQGLIPLLFPANRQQGNLQLMSQLNSKLHTSPDQLIFSRLNQAVRNPGCHHSESPRRPVTTGVIGRSHRLTGDGVRQTENQMMKIWVRRRRLARYSQSSLVSETDGGSSSRCSASSRRCRHAARLAGGALRRSAGDGHYGS